MKSLVIKLVIPIVLFGQLGCKKDKDKPIDDPSTSKWSFAGVNYKAPKEGFLDNSLLATQQDIEKQIFDRLIIRFGSKPVAARTYTVTDHSLFDSNETSLCGISFTIATPSIPGEVFSSVGGGSISVTIIGDEITATFDNVPMASIGGPAGTITGSIKGKVIGP